VFHKYKIKFNIILYYFAGHCKIPHIGQFSDLDRSNNIYIGRGYKIVLLYKTWNI